MVSGRSAYRAIGYERQSQLKLRHKFDTDAIDPLIDAIGNVNYTPSPENNFSIRFDLSPVVSRKIKRGGPAYDLTSIREGETYYDAMSKIMKLAQDLMYEMNSVGGYTISSGPHIWGYVDDADHTIKTRVEYDIPTVYRNRPVDVELVAKFFSTLMFSVEEVNYARKATASVLFNGEVLASTELSEAQKMNPALEFAKTYYANEEVQNILWDMVKNRNSLYVFLVEKEFEDGSVEKYIRPGRMILTDNGWEEVEITRKQDIADAVQNNGVVEFIPAVNRIDEMYPSVITIETDPGDMMVHMLGKEKTWRFNSYIIEKVCTVL